MEQREGYKKTKIGLIPEDWDIDSLQTLTLNDGGIRRGPFGGAIKKAFFVSEGYKIYEQKHVIKNNFSLGDYFISDEKFQELQNFTVKAGDLLVSCSGTIGKIVKVPKGIIEGVINQALLRIRLDEDIVNQTYFLHCFQSDSFQRKIIDNTQGGAMKNLVGMTEFRNVPFALPPLPEQKKIASILTTVDDKISFIENQIQQTEQLKKGLMEKLLTEGIGHTDFKDTKIGRIPKGWDVKKLGDILTEKPEYGANASAIEYNEETTFRYIRITDIDDGGKLHSNDSVGIPKENNESYVLKKYDLIIARTGNTVGKSYLYLDDNNDCAYAGYLIRFRIDKNMYNVQLLFHILHSPLFWNWVKSILRVGAQPNINAKEYQSFSIPLPSLEEQKQIASILSTVDDKIEILNQKKSQYQTLKKGLSQQLLTGQMRVKI